MGLEFVPDDILTAAVRPDDAALLLAARIAAQYSREREFETVGQIARDSVACAFSALTIRRRRRGEARGAIDQLTEIAARYGARVVLNDDPLGMAVGLRFASGKHVSGFRNIFFLA